MLRINAKAIMDDALRALDGAQKQVAFAMAKAMTDTIKDVRDAEVAEMRKVFLAPTPYTLRSLYIRPATKARLEAVAWLKDSARPTHYLLPQIEGGSRGLKRFEQRMVMHGLMRADQRAVPAAGAKMDAYGNMSRGQIVQILSQLRTAVVQGDYSNASNSKRSRAKRQAMTYFVSHGKGSMRYGYQGRRGRGLMYEQHLPAGVWARYQFAWGSSVKPVLLFVGHTRYAKRLDFYGIAERVITARLPVHLSASVSLALSTAGLSHRGAVL
jgi:hypothetical protein